MITWDVMYLCEKQLRDVNPNDILNNGLYRKCNTYKGGGGYDKFPEIYNRRYENIADLNNQFVAQLRGCPLRCEYCYVTEDGVFKGDSCNVSSKVLVNDFLKSGCRVFHLMGGAPALYIDNWHSIIKLLPSEYVFHSDLLLVENVYKEKTIEKLVSLSKTHKMLFAVSIKGADSKEFEKNTRTKFDTVSFLRNLDLIIRHRLPFYITYTGMNDKSIEHFNSKVKSCYPADYEWILQDAFPIDIVHYKALD